jgi:transposase
LIPYEPYEASVEQEMRKFYNTLSEKDKRRYAAVEALKLGRGGIAYIVKVLGCSRKTVKQGIKELKRLPIDSEYNPRIRQSGAGRKSYDQVYPDIDQKFLDVLHDYTAGDPMQEDVLWTDLTMREIASRLAEKHGIHVSLTVIHQLLDKHNYGRRKAQKKETMKTVKDRDAQFENISKFKAEYQSSGNPIISFDSKKKEPLGNYYRPGHLYTTQELHTYDHDFNSFADGVVIPHGIYDICENRGYINLGISKDTSEFACDSIRNWWYNEGQYLYPQATSILALCDGGGSNNAHHNIFKEDLQKLSDQIGIEIRIAHYPPYTSKYNPIEHRLFPHVTRACQGVVFKSVDLVKELMEKTRTSKGLRVTVNIIDKVYQTGRKVAVDFKKNMTIKFDDFLPKWNYTAVPNG